MILSLEGNAGVGKSTLMYSAPLPLVALAFDAGSVRALYGSMHELFTGVDIQIVPYPHMFMEQPVTKASMPMVRKYWQRNDGKAITVYMLPEPIQMGSKLAGVRYLWAAFDLIVQEALADKDVKSVGIDTGTIMRQVAADAYLETLQATPRTADREQLIRIEWKNPNDKCSQLYGVAKQISDMASLVGENKNMIVTHHMTDVYINVPTKDGGVEGVVKLKPDGQTPYEKLKGLDDTYKHVDIALRMETVDLPGKKAGEMDAAIQATFVKAGLNLRLTNKKIVNPTWDSLADMINEGIAVQAQVKKR